MLLGSRDVQLALLLPMLLLRSAFLEFPAVVLALVLASSVILRPGTLVVSCAAVDPAVADVLTAVGVPGVSARESAIVAVSVAVDVPSGTCVSNFSGLTAVVASLLLLRTCRCWLPVVVDIIVVADVHAVANFPAVADIPAVLKIKKFRLSDC